MVEHSLAKDSSSLSLSLKSLKAQGGDWGGMGESGEKSRSSFVGEIGRPDESMSAACLGSLSGPRTLTFEY